MILKPKLALIKNRFLEIWKLSVIFRYAVLIHIFYFILSIFLFFEFYYEKNDYIVFYKAGGIFFNDINDLYNQENYLWDFRYLPLAAVIFIPFYLLGYDLGFIIFHFFNLFLNILICIVLYKIIILIRGEDHEKDDKRAILYISFYLMGLPHVFNYVLGQINLYVVFLILLSLLIFLKYDDLKWQLIGSLILGISLMIKPIMLFIIPFLILIKYDFKNKKLDFNLHKSIIRIFGVLLPLLLNIIVFLRHPKLWEGFLTTNFTGTNPVHLNFSFSVTKLIINFCYCFNIKFNQLVIFIAVASFMGSLGFVIYIFRKYTQNSIVIGVVFSILIMLLAYFDAWDHHLLILTPILIVTIFFLPRNSEITQRYIKPSFFFLSFFDLAFTGIWILTHMIFPFNFASTIFLILAFIGVSKFCLNKESSDIQG
ncbi:MAG: glycosyltransferase 87 family protein [Promethearchaeota archaeon]